MNTFEILFNYDLKLYLIISVYGKFLSNVCNLIMFCCKEFEVFGKRHVDVDFGICCAKYSPLANWFVDFDLLLPMLCDISFVH